MRRSVMHNGFVILCNEDGQILEVVQDTSGLAAVGNKLLSLVGPGSQFKLLDFLAKVKAQGAVFDAEFILTQDERETLLRLQGALYEAKFMITGVLIPGDQTALLQELMSMNSEQTNQLRLALKEKQKSAQPPSSDARLFEELSEINNELVNVQRELAKENAERQKAQAALRAAHDELERRVQARTAELQIANEALTKAMKAKDEFMAAMSHELRTPLASILGLAEVLQYPYYGSLSDKQLKAILNIENSGRRLLELVGEVMDYTQIQSGNTKLHIRLCSLEQICAASLDTVRSQAAAKTQQLEFSVSPSVIQVEADEERLAQILVNLLENAVKFTPPQGSIRLEAVGSVEMGQVQIRVTDTGIGIKAEDFPRLFHPFVQLDARLSRGYEGTGLGLVLVKAFAELHGGSVSVESVFDQGSTFTVTLPWRGA